MTEAPNEPQTSKTFMERLEDVLDAKGLRTFDPPLTLDYRFGSIPAEIGVFRCFVNEADVMQAPSYLEIKGDHVYFVALDYPGLEEFLRTVRETGTRCFKTLGRMHTAYFILALEHSLPPQEHAALIEFFTEYRNTLPNGSYHILKIWDEAALREEEKRIQAGWGKAE
ncbi:MAG: hypothetical protein ACE15F_20525 [bacterium]